MRLCDEKYNSFPKRYRSRHPIWRESSYHMAMGQKRQIPQTSQTWSRLDSLAMSPARAWISSGRCMSLVSWSYRRRWSIAGRCYLKTARPQAATAVCTSTADTATTHARGPGAPSQVQLGKAGQRMGNSGGRDVLVGAMTAGESTGGTARCWTGATRRAWHNLARGAKSPPTAAFGAFRRCRRRLAA